jgi:hypothetical protein
MTNKISEETLAMLRRCVEGQVSSVELEDWLVGAEYDTDLSLIERDNLAHLRLVMIEVGEGRRSAEQIQVLAAKIIGEN